MEPTTAQTGWIRERNGSAGQISNTLPVTFNLRFPGQQFDEETGLHYNHHRYYDPYLTVGYTEADPLGLAAGWNRFGYANANPLLYTDPQGLFAPVAVCTANPAVCGIVVRICAKAVVEIAKAVAAGLQVDVVNCDEKLCNKDDKDGEDCETATDYHLKKAGIFNAHEFKRDFYGKKAPIRLYDICACKDGSIKLTDHGVCGFSGPKLDTGYRWK